MKLLYREIILFPGAWENVYLFISFLAMDTILKLENTN